ncbi:MAG: DUF2177 family protein [Legionellaceae bacterium]|nr:DUF2177 family protein [Legionellaceae bacterium]
MPHIKVLLTAVIVFVITDAIWLGVVAKSAYFKHYSPWLALVGGELKVVWWAAAMVYVLFAISLLFFIFPLAKDNIIHALGYGALLGCIIYGVYDFTLIAIMKDWPIKMGLIDWAWGTFLYGSSSMITMFVSQHFFKMSAS